MEKLVAGKMAVRNITVYQNKRKKKENTNEHTEMRERVKKEYYASMPSTTNQLKIPLINSNNLNIAYIYLLT